MNTKRTIALLLCISIMVGLMPMHAVATAQTEETAPPTEIIDAALEQTNSLGEVGDYLVGNMLNTASLYKDRKFTQPTGFGFAAEQGNNLVDQFRWQNSSVLGDSFEANGADRKIINRDGSITLIQS